MNTLNEVLLADNEKQTFGMQLLFKMLGQIQSGTLEIHSPAGQKYFFQGVAPGVRVTLQVRDWSFCEDLFLKGDIGLGESYIAKKWDCDHIENLIIFGISNKDQLEQFIKGSILRIFSYRLKHLFNRNTKNGSQKNIHAHYDLGNSFYSLWLDSTMTYSSGLFLSEKDSLEEAQTRKYEAILNKLELKEGDHILEIGCGWGGFLEHAAKKGIRVTGVTISKEQYDFALKRIQSYQNLADVQFCDYRDLKGKYDHIVSIEMFEAIGEAYWKTYFRKVHSLLRAGGSAVIQSITINEQDFKSYRKGTDFIQQYIFPGGMLPSPERFKIVSEGCGLILNDQLDFGKDYGETLKRWEVLFSSKIESVKKINFDERFIRTWRFYLKYCEGGFAAGKIGVSQFKLTKPKA